MQIEFTKTINAPIADVFTAFTDISKIEERIDGIKKVEILEGGPTGEGTKWRETREMFGKDATEEMWISNLQENKSYEVLAESNGTKYRTVYTFTEVDGGVRVDGIFEGIPQTVFAKIMSVMVFFMKGKMVEMMTADMTDLANILEGTDTTEVESEVTVEEEDTEE